MPPPTLLTDEDLHLFNDGASATRVRVEGEAAPHGLPGRVSTRGPEGTSCVEGSS
jgi:hypothetical protein